MRAATRDASAHSTLRRDGYAVLEGLLEAAEVAALLPEIAQRIAAPAGPACERPHNTLVPLRWDDAVVGRVLAPQRRRRRLCEAAGGDDLRWISGYLTLKEPRSPAQPRGAGAVRDRPARAVLTASAPTTNESRSSAPAEGPPGSAW